MTGRPRRARGSRRAGTSAAPRTPAERGTAGDAPSAGRGAAPRPEPVPVATLTVPALLGGLVVGIVSGYLLGPWAGVLVLVVAVGAVLLAALRPDQREVAVAGAGGIVLGYGGVMLLALMTVLSA